MLVFFYKVLSLLLITQYNARIYCSTTVHAKHCDTPITFKHFRHTSSICIIGNLGLDGVNIGCGAEAVQGGYNIGNGAFGYPSFGHGYEDGGHSFGIIGGYGNAFHEDHGVNTVYHRPPMVVHQPPDLVHRPDIVLHRAPIVVHQRPVIYHQAPVVVHKPPVVIHQSPVVVHPVIHHHKFVTHHVHDIHVVPVAHHNHCGCQGKKDCICDTSNDETNDVAEEAEEAETEKKSVRPKKSSKEERTIRSLVEDIQNVIKEKVRREVIKLTYSLHTNEQLTKIMNSY